MLILVAERLINGFSTCLSSLGGQKADVMALLVQSKRHCTRRPCLTSRLGSLKTEADKGGSRLRIYIYINIIKIKRY